MPRQVPQNGPNYPASNAIDEAVRAAVNPAHQGGYPLAHYKKHINGQHSTPLSVVQFVVPLSQRPTLNIE